ncbi:MAG: hypothetical protein MI725_07940 [Pirellulales bacterium]|nr:hypothetical protein [Pirellulales bacterium]
MPAGVAVTSEQAPTALPLIGLALQEAQGHPPLVDLLHPRQRPAPRNRRATYALLATAASALLALVGWQAYAALQAPLTAAEIAQAQWEELEETLAAHADAERQAATIGNWQQNSGNLLTTLEQLSLTLRPEPLDSQTFPVGDDTVLQRFDLTGRRVTLQGAVRNDSRVPPLEAELREQAQRVRREESKPNTDIPGYPWGYKFIVDVAGNPSAPEGSSR